MTERLISANELKKEIDQYGYYLTYRDAIEEINRSPTVKAVPLSELLLLKEKYGANCRLGHAIKILEREYGDMP